MFTDSKKTQNCFNWGYFQTTANKKGGNHRWVNIDPTVVGDIITHERTTWTKSNQEVKNWCVGGKGSITRCPLRFNGEVYVCPQALEHLFFHSDFPAC